MKIGVVGWGAVGVSLAYALVMSRVGPETLLSQITARKGATFHVTGRVLARVVDVPSHHQRAILTVFAPIPGIPGCEGVTLAYPHGADGQAARPVIPPHFSDGYQTGFPRSAASPRDSIRSLNLTPPCPP